MCFHSSDDTWSKLVFDRPIAPFSGDAATFHIPAKETGDHILATLDDISAPVVLVATHADASDEERKVTTKEGMLLAEGKNIRFFHEVSTFSWDNVDQCFSAMIQESNSYVSQRKMARLNYEPSR